MVNGSTPSPSSKVIVVRYEGFALLVPPNAYLPIPITPLMSLTFLGMLIVVILQLKNVLSPIVVRREGSSTVLMVVPLNVP